MCLFISYYCWCRTTRKHTCKIVLYIFHIFNGLSNHLFRIQNINIYLLAHFQCYPIARATTDNYSTIPIAARTRKICRFCLFLLAFHFFSLFRSNARISRTAKYLVHRTTNRTHGMFITDDWLMSLFIAVRYTASIWRVILRNCYSFTKMKMI